METTTVPVSYPTLPMSIVLPIFASLAIVCNWVPFLSLYRVKNMAACTMIAVVITMNFFTWINAILWPSDDIATWWNGHGLCDIEVYVRTVCATLIATSTCCLTRNLAQAVDADKPRLFETASQRRRRFIEDLLFVFLIPFLQLVLHYLIQANRYAIITVYGCADVIDYSWPTIAIFLVWPSFFSLLNCYYAIIVMFRLSKHRGRLTSTLSSNGSGFTARRFLKLFFMSCSFLVIYMPVTLAFLYFNLPIPLIPYSFSRIHAPASWDPIIYLTTAEFPRLQYYGWPAILMGVFVFFYYGLNNEAIETYRKFACTCGLSKIWPSLSQPREVRRRGSTDRGSWTGHLDFVGKAMNYFDRRKHSQATSTETAGSEANHSRKNSYTTDQTLHLTTITSATTSSHNDDQITPIPSPTHLLPMKEEPSSDHKPAKLTPTPIHPRTILASFRTHMHLPPLPYCSNSSSPTQSTRSREVDIEAQHSPSSSRRLSAHNPTGSLDATARTVETNIWSGPAVVGFDGVRSAEGNVLGTRAFRERERREMFGGNGNGNGNGKGNGEVIVVKSIEREVES